MMYLVINLNLLRELAEHIYALSAFFVSGSRREGFLG